MKGGGTFQETQATNWSRNHYFYFLKSLFFNKKLPHFRRLYLGLDKKQRGNNIVKSEFCIQRKCEMLCTAHWPVIFLVAPDFPNEASSNPNLKNLYNQIPY